jgi:hypothetical protein
MKSVELTPQMNIPEIKIERSEAAAIIGETAERLLEFAEIAGEGKAQRWILRLACLFQSECPRSAWLYLRLSTGDLSELTASHATHGETMHRSKQAEHKEHKEALRVIAKNYPELADAIRELENKCQESPPII